MKIRTKDDLWSVLAKDLTWRKKELSAMKGLITVRHENPMSKEALLRGSFALIYAHFEGYIKKASVSYVEFVRMQRLSYKDLSDHFFNISVKQKFHANYGSKKFSDFLPVTAFFRTEKNSTAKFNHKNVIDTASNISSLIFKEIIYTLGLDYSKFEGIEKLIDIKLLEKRNHIAHGEFLDVDIDDYLLVNTRILELLENFKTQIENQVSEHLYIVKSSRPLP